MLCMLCAYPRQFTLVVVVIIVATLFVYLYIFFASTRVYFILFFYIKNC